MSAKKNLGRRREGTAALRLTGDGTYSETVYLVLKRAIVEGTIGPGERLREQDLGERLKVSRTPVREALKKLQGEDLIVFEPGRGMIVSAPTSEEVIDIYVLREVLEGVAARLAAERAAETDLARLEALVKGIEKATVSRDDEHIVRLNADFHSVLWRMTGNKRLLRILEDLQDSLHRYQRSTLLHSAGRPKEALTEHRAIFEAIRARDGRRAESAARDHMRRVRDIRIAMSVEGDERPGRTLSPSRVGV